MANFKGAPLSVSRFPLISADLSTSAHLSLGTVAKRECWFSNARARNADVEATSNHPFPAQVQSDDATLQLLADPLLVEDIAFHGPIPAGGEVRWRGNPLAWTVDGARVAANERHFRDVLAEDRAAVEANGGAAKGCEGGHLQSAPLSVVFHSFWPMFRRAIVSRSGLDARTSGLDRASARGTPAVKRRRITLFFCGAQANGFSVDALARDVATTLTGVALWPRLVFDRAAQGCEGGQLQRLMSRSLSTRFG